MTKRISKGKLESIDAKNEYSRNGDKYEYLE
jgi:hypothetical protein